MRKFLMYTLVGAFVLSMAACEEEKGPAFVSGLGSINPPGGTEREFRGDLSHANSTKYYGHCQFVDGKFEIEVGDAPLAKVEELPGALYFRFKGIEGSQDGAPVIGVFEPGTDQPRMDPDLYSHFATATVASNDVFNFSGGVDNCRVELFAEAAEGELVPDILKEFKYYVRINCNGMQATSGNNSGIALSSVYFEAYFHNC